ncbi:hypothetical protein A2188_01715 [Candidatus Woesebacteria bacterium RIFOXYA1_FULL_43_9]|uniref:Nucleotidyl transferase AbiEii toxin, Type IV TA system n=1 Tax=Candidatus Woesebacteria bacterium RIFOXYA1_FULL_43_9 TaxID=1802534 RepID=A0A1F8CPV0_9BACT|nr:MAG: hypothetical protein A2188_01715 [Candidatus Woesebacteria bacterium RIFOXYA1_FULL_43_9]
MLNCQIIRAANEAHIDPHDVIIVGGIAVFHHALSVLGQKAATYWRGTHDIDLVITQRGAAQQIMTVLSNQSGKKTIENIEANSSHFSDKDTWTVEVVGNGSLGKSQRRIDIDIYRPKNDEQQTTKFNQRTLGRYPGNFITRPVKMVTIGKSCQSPKAALPCLTDCLILKLDVAALSSKLRDKDILDVLLLTAISERKGINPRDVFHPAVDNFFRFSSQATSHTVAQAIRSLPKNGQRNDRGAGFSPSCSYLDSCIRAIGKY